MQSRSRAAGTTSPSVVGFRDGASAQPVMQTQLSTEVESLHNTTMAVIISRVKRWLYKGEQTVEIETI